jgi:hypothetical protein
MVEIEGKLHIVVHPRVVRKMNDCHAMLRDEFLKLVLVNHYDGIR